MASTTRIRIEYADGNTDEIELLSDNDAEVHVYWLRRTAYRTQEVAEGIYAADAIAGFLYQTTLACQHTDFDFAFDFRNPKAPSPARDASSQAA